MKKTEKTKKHLGGKLRPMIRGHLLDHPDGLDLSQICELIGYNWFSVYRSIKRMPDVYVSHWVVSPKLRAKAIFRAVVVPPNAPRPTSPQDLIEFQRMKKNLHDQRQAEKEAALAKASQPPKGYTKEEAEARQAAMVARYSNPPTYKALQ